MELFEVAWCFGGVVFVVVNLGLYAWLGALWITGRMGSSRQELDDAPTRDAPLRFEVALHQLQQRLYYDRVEMDWTVEALVYYQTFPNDMQRYLFEELETHEQVQLSNQIRECRGDAVLPDTDHVAWFPYGRL